MEITYKGYLKEAKERKQKVFKSWKSTMKNIKFKVIMLIGELHFLPILRVQIF